MNKKLVAYFSATGVTAKVANCLAEAIGADIFEIEPAQKYTEKDLNWHDKNSRSSIEMADLSARPAIKWKREDMSDFDVLYVGFPIWWCVAPRIINTFLESYDLTGKTIIPFATSGGSGISGVRDSIQKSCPGAILEEARLLGCDISLRELSDCF